MIPFVILLGKQREGYLSLKVNSHFTRHDASRYIAIRCVAQCAFLSVHTGKTLPDVFSYNGVTTRRPQQEDILLALALKPQVIALNVLQKQRKSDDFRF